MSELDSVKFLTADDIELVDQRTSDAGFFSAIGAASLAEGLILGDPEARYIVDLTVGERQFSFYHLRANEPFRRPGLLLRSVTVEVDRTSAYSAEHVTGTAGDIIRADGAWYVVAMNTQTLNDAAPLRLWDAADMTHQGGEVGFRSWRLTIGSGRDREILWERDPSQ